MNDRELLELAAKAAEVKLCVWGSKGNENFADVTDVENHKRWNPLTDDGDALRLAVCLFLDIDHILDEVVVNRSHPHPKVDVSESHDEDPCAATRRAIVRAAAEIGRTIQ